MKRRIIWKYGDSAPLYGQIIAAVQGDGELSITVGFPVSAVEVSFSKLAAIPNAEKLKKKDYKALTTSVDGDLAIAEGLERAFVGSFVVVVNGLVTKTTESYFSRPNSTTPISDTPKAGDRLRWVGSVAGYQLSSTDTVTLINSEASSTFNYEYQNFTAEPEVFVSSINSEGFVLGYKNIPEDLEVNYFVM